MAHTHFIEHLWCVVCHYTSQRYVPASVVLGGEALSRSRLQQGGLSINHVHDTDRELGGHDGKSFELDEVAHGRGGELRVVMECWSDEVVHGHGGELGGRDGKL